MSHKAIAKTRSPIPVYCSYKIPIQYVKYFNPNYLNEIKKSQQIGMS